MKKHCCGKQNRGLASLQPDWRWIRHNTLFIGLASLVWLVFKTGRKPSRIQYPCQQTAVTNVSLFILPLLLPLIQKTYRYLKACGTSQAIRFAVTATVLIGMILSGSYLWAEYQQAKQIKYYDQLKSRGPFGVKVAGSSAAATGFLSIPHAMAIPEPHRVVSVHHSGATSWDFQCTNRDPCPVYYGDDTYVDQDVVDQMVSRGMLALTDTDAIDEAWDVILPEYQSGEIVAVKVNFNCASYDDDDAYVDALPQIVNSVIAGLITRGVAESNIRVYDSTRPIPDRFRALIDYPGIQYYGSYGRGDEVARSSFNSELESAHIDFSGSGYTATSHKISDVLVESDYLINIPIMKKHGGAGITLSSKNHFGSINLSGFDHDYIYLNRDEYDRENNPIVDINKNTHIKDKTVLIIGDALYAGWSSNNTPPQRWVSFGNDSPNMLFFAVDPVAVDSVMFDYLVREGEDRQGQYVREASEDILVIAAEEGLGIHERWNSNTERQYATIDYVEINLEDSQAPTVPTDLSLSALSSTQVELNWSESTDTDGRVAGYYIYRDGVRIGSTRETSYLDENLSPAMQYTYAVSAYDFSGNESDESTASQVTTLAESDRTPSNRDSDSNSSGCFLNSFFRSCPAAVSTQAK